MKKIFLIISYSFIVIAGSFAQSKTSIKKAFAFAQFIMPGTIMADDNGRPIKPPLNISRVIYIETNGRIKPNIESVQYKNEIFKVSIYPVTILPVTVGIKKENGSQVILNPSKENTLWKLELQSTDNKKIMETPEPYKKIILKENIKRKIFKFTIDKEIELESPLSV